MCFPLLEIGCNLFEAEGVQTCAWGQASFSAYIHSIMHIKQSFGTMGIRIDR